MQKQGIVDVRPKSSEKDEGVRLGDRHVYQLRAEDRLVQARGNLRIPVRTLLIGSFVTQLPSAEAGRQPGDFAIRAEPRRVGA